MGEQSLPRCLKFSDNRRQADIDGLACQVALKQIPGVNNIMLIWMIVLCPFLPVPHGFLAQRRVKINTTEPADRAGKFMRQGTVRTARD